MLWVYQQHMLALTAPGLLIVGVYFPVMLRWKGATLGKLANDKVTPIGPSQWFSVTEPR